MVYKQVKTKKTPTGYSIIVFVQDGELVKPLVAGIQRFFVAVEEAQHPERTKQIRLEAEEEAKRLKEAKIVHERIL